MLDKAGDEEQIGKRPHGITMSHMESFAQREVGYDSQTHESATYQQPKILFVGQLSDQYCQEWRKNEQTDILCHKPICIGTDGKEALTQGNNAEWFKLQKHKHNRYGARIKTSVSPRPHNPARLKTQIYQKVAGNHHIQVYRNATEYQQEVREQKIG